MNLELNGHAKTAGEIIAWLVRALVAVLAAILVARSERLDTVADVVHRLESRLTRVETEVKNVKEQLGTVEGRVYWIQRRTEDEER